MSFGVNHYADSVRRISFSHKHSKQSDSNLELQYTTTIHDILATRNKKERQGSMRFETI
jgi:hypothetical protein